MIDIQQPLKFYSSDGLQLRHKQALTGYKNVPTLRVSPTALIPFIIQREKAIEDQDDWYDEVNVNSVIAYNTVTGASTNLTDYIGFKYGVRSLSDVAYDFAMYDGNSTIPSGVLKNGRYELRITDEDSNTFFSETFRVWSPSETIKFEFRNSVAFNNMWFYGSAFYYIMEFVGITYGKTEHDEFINILSDINNHTGEKLQQRKDKIMTASFLADNLILDAIQLMEMCDEIYCTDELGNRSEIKVFGISVEDSDSGDHVHVNVDYRIPENMLTLSEQSVSFIGESIGVNTISRETGVWIGGKKVHIGGKKVKI